MFTGQERMDCILCADGTDAELHRALASVAVQSVAADIDMTLVVPYGRAGDAAAVAGAFDDFASLTLLEGVPGEGFAQCWQRGIDHTHAEIFFLLRAVQTLGGIFAMQMLRCAWRTAEKPVAVIASVQRQQDVPGLSAALETRYDDRIDPAGKLYTRSAVEKSGARFLDSSDEAVFAFGAALQIAFEKERFLTVGDIACFHHLPAVPAHREELPPPVSHARRTGMAVSLALNASGEATFPIARFALEALATLYHMRLAALFGGQGDPDETLRAARGYYAGAYARCEAVIPPEAIESYAAMFRQQLPPPVVEQLPFDVFIASLPDNA